ncbi:hypothetical protein [Melittangium boletus]|uniref:hypothetical protein n=1 Tax=Melittangium boletus TaxID=83453 RepID=UPI003DA44B85
MTGRVVDLQGARLERRLELYRTRVAERHRTNRAAVEALYQGGTLFTPQGTRAGRALLRAQQLLQRASGLVELLSGEGVVPAPRLPAQVDALYRELDTLLSRSDALSGRHARVAGVARLPGR